jgi:cytochrome P450
MACLFERRDPSRADWSRDQLDSPLPPVAEAPYFDKALNAWVFSRYSDILAAFRAPELAPASPSSETSAPLQEKHRLQMRAETQQTLSPQRLREWREWLTQQSMKSVEAIQPDTSIDLLAGYARPLCLTFAATVTGIQPDDAEKLCDKARTISAAAAEPYDETLRTTAKSADAELQNYFKDGPEGLRDSGFVALSQTMPCLLGNAWFALLQHPHQWAMLHRQPDLIEQAIEELLRYAGLVRILRRIATADVSINGVHIRKDDRIILRIFAANRDPERFTHPNEVDITRPGGAHLTLGAGPHSCVGASLIRLTAVTITSPLLSRFAAADLARPVEWQGGSGFRSPNSLWVYLRKSTDNAPSS